MTMQVDHVETSTHMTGDITSSTVLKLSLTDWGKLITIACAMTISVAGFLWSHAKEEAKERIELERRVLMLENERRYRDLQIAQLVASVEEMKTSVNSLDTKVTQLLMNQEVIKTTQQFRK